MVSVHLFQIFDMICARAQEPKVLQCLSRSPSASSLFIYLRRKAMKTTRASSPSDGRPEKASLNPLDVLIPPAIKPASTLDGAEGLCRKTRFFACAYSRYLAAFDGSTTPSLAKMPSSPSASKLTIR